MSIDQVRSIKQLQPISNELVRPRTQCQEQNDNYGSVWKASPGGFRRCLATYIKANPAEPNFVSGSNAHGTIDPSAVYECSVS